MFALPATAARPKVPAAPSAGARLSIRVVKEADEDGHDALLPLEHTRVARDGEGWDTQLAMAERDQTGWRVAGGEWRSGREGSMRMAKEGGQSDTESAGMNLQDRLW